VKSITRRYQAGFTADETSADETSADETSADETSTAPLCRFTGVRRLFAAVSTEESRPAETNPSISDGFLSVERNCSG